MAEIPFRTYTADTVIGMGKSFRPDESSDDLGWIDFGIAERLSQGLELFSIGYDAQGQPATFVFKAL